MTLAKTFEIPFAHIDKRESIADLAEDIKIIHRPNYKFSSNRRDGDTSASAPANRRLDTWTFKDRTIPPKRFALCQSKNQHPLRSGLAGDVMVSDQINGRTKLSWKVQDKEISHYPNNLHHNRQFGY